MPEPSSTPWASPGELYPDDREDSREMPFASGRHHEFWTADVRYLDMLDEELLADGMVYAIAILENHSRAVLASSVTRKQDLNAFLSVLFRAVQEYGPPEAFVTDSGSIFLANRAQAIYRALGIRKLEIEKGQPWQSYIETALTVPIECPSMYYRLRRIASGVQKSARGRRRRDSGRSSDAARWRARLCV